MNSRIKATRQFAHWLENLKDVRGRARILARIKRLSEGHPGSFRHLKQSVRELKIDTGPGYRVYYMQFRRRLIVLLCGGDKFSQSGDIKLAYRLAQDLGDQNENRTG